MKEILAYKLIKIYAWFSIITSVLFLIIEIWFTLKIDPVIFSMILKREIELSPNLILSSTLIFLLSIAGIPAGIGLLHYKNWARWTRSVIDVIYPVLLELEPVYIIILIALILVVLYNKEVRRKFRE